MKNNMNMHYLEEPESKYNLIERTKDFTLDCILLTEKLPNTYLGNHVKGQLIRCNTSVASNYRAARLAQSRNAFIAKISIVIGEADESEFWLEIILDKNLLIKSTKEVFRLKNEAYELTSIFVQSRKTAQSNKH